MGEFNHGSWQPLRPEEVKSLFIALPIPWWFAGGWSLDLFLDRQTRLHKDIDVCILRKDQLSLQHYLANWILYKTNQPGLAPWLKDDFLSLGVNSIWCKPTAFSPWKLEVLFLESDGDQWFYRRKPTIHLPLEQIGIHSVHGFPLLSPTIQLLFKAKYHSQLTNQLDFDNVLPRLTLQQKKWLQFALLQEFPTGHPWLVLLEESL